jgi:glyceraldehyde 3-phosphate dehydrogenase
LSDPKTNAHLLKHDSNYGAFPGTVEVTDDGFVVNGEPVKVFKERDPANLKWGDVGVDIVVESTGFFTDATKARAHIDSGGAKKVIISAPAKNEDITIAMGVNNEKYDAASHHVVSNASCTTNCLAPIAKVILDNYGIESGLMNTIHSYTNDQQLLDLPHKDLRRARAAALSIIPTTTGAAKAIGLVLPELKGKLDGISLRVPTPNVSIVDLVAEVEKSTTKEEVNAAMKKAAEGSLRGLLQYSEEPLVSVDFRKNPHSSILDAPYTAVLEGNMVKLLSWYDNEWGYSSRVVDLIGYLVKRGL